MIKLGEMVLKGVGHTRIKLGQWSSKESIGYPMIQLGQMVLKGVSWVYNDKIRSNGVE